PVEPLLNVRDGASCLVLLTGDPPDVSDVGLDCLPRRHDAFGVAGVLATRRRGHIGGYTVLVECRGGEIVLHAVAPIDVSRHSVGLFGHHVLEGRVLAAVDREAVNAALAVDVLHHFLLAVRQTTHRCVLVIGAQRKQIRQHLTLVDVDLLGRLGERLLSATVGDGDPAGIVRGRRLDTAGATAGERNTGGEQSDTEHNTMTLGADGGTFHEFRSLSGWRSVFWGRALLQYTLRSCYAVATRSRRSAG